MEVNPPLVSSVPTSYPITGRLRDLRSFSQNSINSTVLSITVSKGITFPISKGSFVGSIINKSKPASISPMYDCLPKFIASSVGK